MQTFSQIRARAVARHGEADLASRLSAPRSDRALRATPDDRYLAAMAKRVFAAGFNWSVIEAKWPGFEAAFEGFTPLTVAAYDAESIERLLGDARIVRNQAKILATISNAVFVEDVGGFGRYLADWPATDTIGLWRDLQERGSRLGGDTGAWFLRDVGKDTFRFSPDVVRGLAENGVIAAPKKDGAPPGKKDQAAAQEAFNAWAAESGLPLCQISVILSCSVGDVHAH
jgi:3-methyladenine DNA glycosylase Tag